ncbi:hypothetical protein BN1200_1100086 [Klebsiella variicola]|nr:hypothetical protein BN1200_1100086 [Klebsiella variicola]
MSGSCYVQYASSTEYLDDNSYKTWMFQPVQFAHEICSAQDYTNDPICFLLFHRHQPNLLIVLQMKRYPTKTHPGIYIPYITS